MNGSAQYQKILIPLRQHERIEPFLPYIEELVRPGSTVIFLVPISHNRFKLVTDQLLAMNTGLMHQSATSRHNDEAFAWRNSLVEQRIFSTCVKLREQGIKIIVSVFAGSLRKVMRDYTEKQDLHLIIMRGTAGNSLSRAARRVGFFANAFRATALPPVLLFHPSSGIG